MAQNLAKYDTFISLSDFTNFVWRQGKNGLFVMNGQQELYTPDKYNAEQETYAGKKIGLYDIYITKEDYLSIYTVMMNNVRWDNPDKKLQTMILNKVNNLRNNDTSEDNIEKEKQQLLEQVEGLLKSRIAASSSRVNSPTLNTLNRKYSSYTQPTTFGRKESRLQTVQSRLTYISSKIKERDEKLISDYVIIIQKFIEDQFTKLKEERTRRKYFEDLNQRFEKVGYLYREIYTRQERSRERVSYGYEDVWRDIEDGDYFYPSHYTRFDLENSKADKKVYRDNWETKIAELEKDKEKLDTFYIPEFNKYGYNYMPATKQPIYSNDPTLFGRVLDRVSIEEYFIKPPNGGKVFKQDWDTVLQELKAGNNSSSTKQTMNSRKGRKGRKERKGRKSRRTTRR